MKKRVYGSLLILLLVVLSACSADPESVKEPQIDAESPADQGEAMTKPDDKTTGDKIEDRKAEPLTQQEVLSAIADELQTNVEKILPNHLPLEKGQHLTAKTESRQNEYFIDFYSTKELIPINNEILKEERPDIKKIANLKVKIYSSEKEADETIGFEDYSKVGGQKVDLGFEITGYQDAGVGNLWTSWNEGRWALATHTSIQQPEQGVDLAKQSVKYLEEHTLPIPKMYGAIRLDATGDNCEF